jgi:hypothetical protein
VVGGVDTRRVVDGVGVDPNTVESGLDAAQLGAAEVAALPDDLDAKLPPLTRMASLARSPTLGLSSVLALT